METWDPKTNLEAESSIDLFFFTSDLCLRDWFYSCRLSADWQTKGKTTQSVCQNCRNSVYYEKLISQISQFISPFKSDQNWDLLYRLYFTSIALIWLKSDFSYPLEFAFVIHPPTPFFPIERALLRGSILARRMRWKIKSRIYVASLFFPRLLIIPSRATLPQTPSAWLLVFCSGWIHF